MSLHFRRQSAAKPYPGTALLSVHGAYEINGKLTGLSIKAFASGKKHVSYHNELLLLIFLILFIKKKKLQTSILEFQILLCGISNLCSGLCCLITPQKGVTSKKIFSSKIKNNLNVIETLVVPIKKHKLVFWFTSLPHLKIRMNKV